MTPRTLTFDEFKLLVAKANKNLGEGFDAYQACHKAINAFEFERGLMRGKLAAVKAITELVIPNGAPSLSALFAMEEPACE